MIRTKFKLSRKQYYTRMANLTKAGLIGKDKARYSVTSFGRVVHHSLLLTETAIDNYWKLKAVDSVLNSKEDHNLPEEERQKIVESLIDSKEIKELLMAPENDAYSRSEANEKSISG